MARRRRYQLPQKQNSTFILNINSMTDMFTIMLVFLLQTYNSNPIEIKPVDHLRLPASSSESNPTMAVQLAISEKELTLEGKQIAKIANKAFSPESLDEKDPSFIPSLFKELSEIAEKKKQENKTDKESEEGRVLIQADRSLPYETLRKVMYTASMAGFPKAKLATVLGE